MSTKESIKKGGKVKPKTEKVKKATDKVLITLRVSREQREKYKTIPYQNLSQLIIALLDQYLQKPEILSPDFELTDSQHSINVLQEAIERLNNKIAELILLGPDAEPQSDFEQIIMRAKHEQD